MTPHATVVFHRLAAQEFRDVRRWYQVRSPSAARRVREQIHAAVERIADNPQSGPTWRPPMRFFKVRRFPYVIYYIVVDPTLVRVLAVAHERRRQGYWVRRISRP